MHEVILCTQNGWVKIAHPDLGTLETFVTVLLSDDRQSVLPHPVNPIGLTFQNGDIFKFYNWQMITGILWTRIFCTGEFDLMRIDNPGIARLYRINRTQPNIYSITSVFPIVPAKNRFWHKRTRNLKIPVENAFAWING